MTSGAHQSLFGVFLAFVFKFVFTFIFAMAMRSRTGKSRNFGHGEPLPVVLPVDELKNANVPAPAPASTRPVARRSGGQIADSEAARALAERAVLARREKRQRADQFARQLRLASDIALFEPSVHAVPFSEEAERFFHALLAQLGEESDGEVSPSVASIARSAAWLTYAHRMTMELATSKAGMFTKASADGRPVLNVPLLAQATRLAEAARQQLIACHHLQQLEAEARARRTAKDSPATAAKVQLEPFYTAAGDEAHAPAEGGDEP